MAFTREMKRLNYIHKNGKKTIDFFYSYIVWNSILFSVGNNCMLRARRLATRNRLLSIHVSCKLECKTDSFVVSLYPIMRHLEYRIRGP